MSQPEIPEAVRAQSRAAFNAFLDSSAPFRAELYRYCRKLTGNVWDADDLLQETLLRGFAALGMTPPVTNPRGYLVRIASHLFIDAQRRRIAEQQALALEATSDERAAPAPSDRAGARNAAAKLLDRLSPQERAALVLKDVFDMSLNEIAQMLSTTENAVKAALHRGRERLKDETPRKTRPASPALIARFIACLEASDRDGLLALLLDSATIEMPPTLVESGRDELERQGGWIWHATMSARDRPKDHAIHAIKWTYRTAEYQGETIVLGLYPPEHGGTLQGINRFEETDGKVSRVLCYTFSPEAVGEVAAALGLEAGKVPYRFPG